MDLPLRLSVIAPWPFRSMVSPSGWSAMLSWYFSGSSSQVCLLCESTMRTSLPAPRHDQLNVRVVRPHGHFALVRGDAHDDGGRGEQSHEQGGRPPRRRRGGGAGGTTPRGGVNGARAAAASAAL